VGVCVWFWAERGLLQALQVLRLSPEIFGGEGGRNWNLAGAAPPWLPPLQRPVGTGWLGIPCCFHPNPFSIPLPLRPRDESELGTGTSGSRAFLP